MKKNILTSVLTLVLSMGALFSQTTTENKFGKGIYNVVAADSSYSMKFDIRMQSLFIGEWNINDSTGIGEGEANFLIRRARLKFGGFAYTPKLKYKIELGLTNRDISGGSDQTRNTPRVILDAVVKWNFHNNWTLWAGQTKLPGNRERVISSANLQFVDRSLVNSRFNIDRDMGIQLRHYHTLGDNFVIREIGSFSMGEGRNVTQGNQGGFQYTGRVEFLPMGKFASKGDYKGGDLKFEEKPKLAIGITYDYNDNAVKTRSNLGSYMETVEGFFEADISTIFVDAMYKHKGVSFMAEYAERDTDTPIAIDEEGNVTGDIISIGNGLNFQLGYLCKNNWEVAGRYTSIELDKEVTGKELETMYTLGVSRYIVGHKLKIQSDVSYITEENSLDDGLMYRLQFDLHF